MHLVGGLYTLNQTDDPSNGIDTRVLSSPLILA